MSRLRILACCAAPALLAACAERADAPLSPTFGKAVASLDAQIVPAPPPTSAPAQTSAARAIVAARRYEADKPLPPQTASTSQVGGYGPSSAQGASP
jgi:hypothetical protein